MKKNILFLLCFVLAGSLCACSFDDIVFRWAEWMEKNNIYETVISVKYEVLEDEELLLRRLDAFGVDIIDIKTTPEHTE